MSPQQLKYLTANWELIATSLTKINARSLRSFSLIMSESVTELARHRVPLVTPYLLLKLSLQKEMLRSNLDNVFRLHILTVELPTLGKDVLTSLTTGRFVNTSNFALLKNSVLPMFMHECFYHLYDNNGFIRENRRKDIAALRQVLMMYYKFEFPFTEEQENEAHQKFIDLDNSVKTTDWPESLGCVRDTLLAVLPPDPYDFVPCHSNGATNTKGIGNKDKRDTWRFNNALYRLKPSLFPPLSYFSVDDRMPRNSKLTVVPKDSRGPRTICMEPHERMYVQKGIMLKLYSHLESNHPTSGFVNFTDQSINQRLAYESSLTGELATLDLKDASDLVSWPLLQKLLKGSDWLEILDVTRSCVVDTAHGPHKLNKFAPMGSALCFPIEALLFWSICRTVTSKVYVYGDDIIVPSIDAANVMSALESYGLAINRDKSLHTGRFRESCGAYYYFGHDVSIVQCKSLDMQSVIEFNNLIFLKFGNSKLRDDLIALAENYFGMFIPRCSSPIVPPVSFISDRIGCNDIFLKRRYNRDLQKMQYRVLQPSTDMEQPFDNDYYMYHEWSTSSVGATSFEEARMIRIGNSVLNKRYNCFMSQRLSVGVNLVKQRTKLKFTWIDVTSF